MSIPTLKLEVEELGGPAPPPMTMRPSSGPPSGRLSTPIAGLELLMKGSNAEADSTPTDQSIDDLAASLNQFVEQPPQMGSSNGGGPRPAVSAPMRIEPMPDPVPQINGGAERTVRLDRAGSATPSIVGAQTAAAVRTENKDKSWDGFRPFAGGSGVAAAAPAPIPKPRLTEAEILAEKFKYLRYLEALEKKPGITVSRRYDMKSSLDEMKAEYELIKAECEKRQSMAFQGKMLMAAVTGLEYLNSKWDPFDIKLDGWGESVNENQSEYEDVFAELHEKYKSKASIAPEIKLMFLLAGSATMVHMTNTMFQPQLPGMDDLAQHNPELANRIASAAADGLVERGHPTGSVAPLPATGGVRGGAQPGQLPPPVHTARPHPVRTVPPPGTVQAPPPSRAEMKGPENFDTIIARVKRKNASSVSFAPPAALAAAPPQPKTVSLGGATVLEGLQKAERTPIRHENRKRKAQEANNVLKLEI